MGRVFIIVKKSHVKGRGVAIRTVGHSFVDERKAAEGQPHSKTLSRVPAPSNRRQLLDCACPSGALWAANTNEPQQEASPGRVPTQSGRGTAALQNLAAIRALRISRQRLGVRLFSAAAPRGRPPRPTVSIAPRAARA